MRPIDSANEALLQRAISDIARAFISTVRMDKRHNTIQTMAEDAAADAIELFWQRMPSASDEPEASR